MCTVLVLLIAFSERHFKQLEELDTIKIKAKGQAGSTGATGWNEQRGCLALAHSKKVPQVECLGGYSPSAFLHSWSTLHIGA